MEKQDVNRIKHLQAQLIRIQTQINDALIKAASGGSKLSIDDLEISVSKLGSSLLRRPIRAARRPVT